MQGGGIKAKIIESWQTPNAEIWSRRKAIKEFWEWADCRKSGCWYHVQSKWIATESADIYSTAGWMTDTPRVDYRPLNDPPAAPPVFHGRIDPTGPTFGFNQLSRSMLRFFQRPGIFWVTNEHQCNLSLRVNGSYRFQLVCWWTITRLVSL